MDAQGSEITDADLEAFVKETLWYQSVRLRHVKTNGTYDHEPHLDRYGFPESLKAKNVLDVGAADGFFSFEFERRGGDVLSVDLDMSRPEVTERCCSPIHREAYMRKYKEARSRNSKWFETFARRLAVEPHSFQIARAILNSNVQFEYRSVYDLRNLQRQFDFVFCGDMIEHLKDPIEAVEILRDVCSGLCIISLSNVVPVPLGLNLLGRLKGRVVAYCGDLGYSFFRFSAPAFERLLLACGFKQVRLHSQFSAPNRRSGTKMRRAVFHCTV